MRISVAALATAALLTGGCTTDDGATHPTSARPDMTIPPWHADLTGKWVTELSLSLGGMGDGGAPQAPLKILAVWNAYQTQTAEVISDWELCAFPLAGLGGVPDDTLSNQMLKGQKGKLDGTMDGAVFTQPTMSFVFGAQLADRARDALPASVVKPCASDGDTGCVTVDGASGKPGFALSPSGGGTYDQIFIDLRVQLAIRGVYAHEGILGGSVPSAAIESHVLGCHQRGGADCTPEEVARLEASHPRIEITGGSLRWRGTGFYVTCPAFAEDPETFLQGTQPMDGGVADMLKGASEETFSSVIQADLDERGCATFGCHDTFTGPGKMHLQFRPRSLEEVRRNYQAVLPFTVGDANSRFVNQVPLPAAMRARWIEWVRNGAKF